MKRRVRVVIKGIVQGVFFRANIEKETKKLGLTGYVCNVEDYVEAVFEGEDEKVKDILEFCAIGPKGVKVLVIEITEQEYVGEFEDFKVR